MSDQAITLTILGVSVVIFVWNKIPVGIVALGVALALWATDILSFDEAISGFSNPTVVLIAALFVVAEGLDAAGVTTWAGQLVVRYAGGSRSRLIVLVMIVVAVLSALITPNGSVAALYPMVVVLAIRMRESPSKLLMPTAFAAHAGALLVLTGSPVTLLISEAMADSGGHALGFFDVALVGLPLLAGTIIVVVLVGSKLLPVRGARSLARDLSALPPALLDQYIGEEEDLVRLNVAAGSSFIGKIPTKLTFDGGHDVHLVAVQDSKGRPRLDEAVSIDSVLVVRGHLPEIEQFAADHQLARVGGPDTPVVSGLISRDFGAAEVIVTPRSPIIGERVFPGMVTDSGSLVVLGMQRYGTDLGVKETKLQAGDSLLLQGSWDALDEHTVDPNVVLVDTPDAIRRQTIPLGPKALPALAILAAMVVLLTIGAIPAAAICLLAAIAMVLLRVVTVDQAHLSMNWSTIILVAGMIPLSTAITRTGAAEMLAGHMIDLVGGGSGYLLMLGIFVLAAALGQMISNTATALILIPITISVAAETGLSTTALLMSLNVACAASLLTPVATPANMMVMGPAGYRFSDYWKLGIVVMLVYLAVAVGLVPLFWHL